MESAANFFASEGGAPLGAQIGAMVIFAILTIAGLHEGFDRIIRRKRGGRCCLLVACASYGIFVWWSSPT